jgi:fluoroacetyl-CoA thioesterase
MKHTLAPGLTHVHRFVVPESKTVPALYPESDEFRAMPAVFATGFLVGLVEWTCILAIAPHLDAGEQTVGSHVDLSHEAATPPGLEVSVRAELVEVDGRKLTFRVEAHDSVDTIARGWHERHLIDRTRFEAKVARKRREDG